MGFCQAQTFFFFGNITASVGKYNASQMQLILKIFFFINLLKILLLSDNVNTCNDYFELHN